MDSKEFPCTKCAKIFMREVLLWHHSKKCNDVKDVKCETKKTEKMGEKPLNDRAKLIFIDTETTGLELDSRVISIAYIITEFEGTELKSTYAVIKPDGKYDASTINNSHIHGLTPAIVNGGTDLLGVLATLESLIHKDDVLVGHNINYDRQILINEAKRLGLELNVLKLRTECTLKMARDKLQGTNHKLGTVYYKFFRETFEGAHNALQDTRACMKCYFALLKCAKEEVQELIFTDQICRHKHFRVIKIFHDEAAHCIFCNKALGNSIINYMVPFGQYKGKPVLEVINTNYNYGLFLLNKCNSFPEKWKALIGKFILR